MPSRRRATSNAAFLAALAFLPSVSIASPFPDPRTPQHTFSSSTPHPPSNSSVYPSRVHGYRGWSSWSLQAYKGKGYGFEWLNETNVKAQADVVARELTELGYDRINVDSGWQGNIDEYGRHLAHEKRFASGIPALQSYLADRGLKLGLYYLPGIDGRAVERRTPVLGTTFTADEIIQCPHSSCLRPHANAFSAGIALNHSHPGAQSYIDSVVELLYSWNVSFVKLDGNVPGSSVDRSHPEWRACDTVPDLRAWRSAIDRLHPRWSAKGRERIWLVASWELLPQIRNDLHQTVDSFRVAIDIEAYARVMTTFDRVIRTARRAAMWSSVDENRGAGLLDLDSVLVNDMTDEEAQSAVTIWALMGSPFYLGDDLTKIKEDRFDLVRNEEVLEVQRRCGRNPARLLNYKSSSNMSASMRPTMSTEDAAALDAKRQMVRSSYGLKPDSSPWPDEWTTSSKNKTERQPEWEQEVWYSEFKNGEVIVGIINAGRLKWWDPPMVVELDLMDLPLRNATPAYTVRDVWQRRDNGIVTRDEKLSLVMERHQAFLWLLKPVP